jgi:triosephosphate isomerase
MQEQLRPLIAGNWKMNGTEAALEQLTRLKTLLEEAGDIAIRIGGQDCHTQVSGAHTGDISATMLLDAGASHVIVGHSERRADHGETSGVVREKAQAALAAGLVPIICVGETESERVEGRANQVVAEQIAHSLPDRFENTQIIVAYEPVWAIGTGRTPTIGDIADMHAHMRRLLVERFGEEGRSALLLYGGSVKPSNAEEILSTDNVNGALVGGASLLANDFFSIIVAA